MCEIAAGEAFRSGDIEAEAEYYRLHFRPTVRDARLCARIVARLRLHFDPAGVLLARAIEDRLYAETSDVAGYNLLSLLAGLDAPALVLHGRAAEAAERKAAADLTPDTEECCRAEVNQDQSFSLT